MMLLEAYPAFWKSFAHPLTLTLSPFEGEREPAETPSPPSGGEGCEGLSGGSPT